MQDDVLSPRLALGRAFPGWTQVWWTYLTGAALPGQTLPRRRPVPLFLRVLAALAAGFALSAAALARHQLWLLLPAYVCTVGAARYLQLVIVHVAAHDNFTRHKLVDVWVGRLLSVVLLFEEFDRYKRGHCVEHHSLRTLSTTKDPTVLFLLSLGIRPGMTPAQMWRRLWLSVASPAFHLRSFAGRIRSHFAGASPLARGLATAYLAAVLAVTVVFRLELLLVVGFLVPLGLVYQTVAAVRLCMEHRWSATPPQERQRSAFTELTPCVYLGAAPPARELAPAARARAWVGWCVRLLGTILVRLIVLPGDSGPAHDYHHYEPRGDWPNYITARRALQSAKSELAGPGLEYIEMWGLLRAIDASFHSFSNATIESADAPSAQARQAARPRSLVTVGAAGE